MPRSICKKVLLATGVALIILGSAALFAYRNAVQAAETADRADHESQILTAADRVQFALADAGARRCGYLLNGGADQRELYEKAVRPLPDHLDRLRRLTAEDAAQHLRADQAVEQATHVRGLLDQSFRLRDDLNQPVNLEGQNALTLQIKDAQARLRGLLTDIKAAEGERLARGNETARTAAGRTMAVLDVGNLLALLVIALALVGVRRDFVLWRRSEDAAEARRRAEREGAERLARLVAADFTLKAHAEKQERMQECCQLEKLGAVGRLASGVAHDFNNLLTVMMGCCEATLYGLRPDDPCREPLGTALQAGETAVSLTRQILSWSRKQPAQLAPLDLNAAATEMSRMLRRLAGDGVELELALDSSVPLVQADRVRLEQVLLNLVVNARDASAPGGRVRVETRKEGAEVALAVIDEGCGMDEATKARLFEPFFTTKGEGKGTGLGMAVVLESVQDCGGRIEVDSAPGRGTAVRVYLPAAEGEARPMAEQERRPHADFGANLIFGRKR